MTVLLGLSYDHQIWLYRVLFFVAPLVAARSPTGSASSCSAARPVQADAHYAELEARAVAAAVSSQPQNPDQSEMERAEERA